jgi:DNA-binding NarL/FixJ family response regulator
MKIMIVDDSAAFRDAMKHMLKKNEDYQIVAEAENGQIALEMMEIHHPDLILMDIEMPVMNGIEATKIMLEKNKELTIIAISSHQEHLYLKDIMRAGFRASVYKNNVFDQLETAIEYAMTGRWYLSV